MAFCPYLSYFVEQSSYNNITDGIVYNDTIPVGISKRHNNGSGTIGGFVHMDCIESLCQLWDTRHNRCGIKVTDYNQGDGDGMIICSDDQCSGSSIPIVTPLVSEYHGNEDLDGNGLIYGVDFVLSDPPPMLQGIPSVSTTMTFQEYKDSIT